MITITIIFPSLSRGKEKDTFKTHFQITEREREVFFKVIFYLSIALPDSALSQQDLTKHQH